ncbi:histone-lysine N-methyltransferase SETD1B [Drosophila albomicans]|uniref:Histone-lysine N-methyltransferase SETD1B n=1 Tax=Drosophila albomicans TaxID=7291 RepID=A0A6P8WIY2_DROAB|nr:histone-lysine N-methyltransferase SETD1B [Drosophila albomicans]
MSKLSALFVLSCLLAFALAVPEPRQLRQQQQQLRQQLQHLQHPYLFLSVPRGRANAGAVVQGFEIVEENEDDIDHLGNDDDDDEDDDAAVQHDDDEDEHEAHLQRGLSLARNGQLVLLKNDAEQDDDDDDEQDDDEQDNAAPQLPLPTQMMVARDQAGAIMVPDGIVEIEGQSIVDEKTGKAALLVPRAALDAIPDGAVVALMERSSATDALAAVGEERANRVIVRRRKNAGRRNVVRRRRGGRRPVQRRRRGGQRRRGGNNRRRNVRVVRPNGNRRRGNVQRRRGGQVMFQG